ncbi:unnamed protein product [Urochloa humidicola]
MRVQQRPEHEPALLAVFLVEAESTGTPFVLVYNKVELVDEQTRIAEFHPSQQSIRQKVFGGFTGTWWHEIPYLAWRHPILVPN